MSRLILACLLLVSCTRQISVIDGDGNISTRRIPNSAPAKISSTPVGETYEVTKSQSCTHPGYCVTCGLGFDGKFGCGVKWFYTCPGTQSITGTAQLHETFITYQLENESVRTPPEFVEVFTVTSEGACQ